MENKEVVPSFEEVNKGNAPIAALIIDNKDWMNDYDTSGCGPREDQKKSYGWFEGQGWVNRWPLHYAAMKGDVKTIKSLIESGRDPNEKMTDWFDSEPLGWSASFNELSASIPLIQGGADPLRPANKAGNTPLKDAERERHTKSINFFKEYEKRCGGKIFTVDEKICSKKIVQNKPKTDFENWLENYDTSGCRPRGDQKKAYGWFEGQGWVNRWPLHYAAMKGDVKTIKSLIESGRDPNEKMTVWYHSEPLGWSASFNELSASIALIQGGADPLRPANKAGNTPLKDAKRERHTKSIHFFTEYEWYFPEKAKKNKERCCSIF